jgi:hypothetical protein
MTMLGRTTAQVTDALPGGSHPAAPWLICRAVMAFTEASYQCRRRQAWSACPEQGQAARTNVKGDSKRVLHFKSMSF